MCTYMIYVMCRLYDTGEPFHTYRACILYNQKTKNVCIRFGLTTCAVQLGWCMHILLWNTIRGLPGCGIKYYRACNVHFHELLFLFT